jgi:EpsI family protein
VTDPNSNIDMRAAMASPNGLGVMRTDSYRSTPLKIAALSVLILQLVVATYPTFRTLAEYWVENDTYSYGFVVPFITAYLIWLRRDRLAVIPKVPSFLLGTCVLVGGMAILVIGRLSSTNLIEQLSLPLMAFGISFLILGRRATREIAFPLAYLLAMIPLWDVLTNRVHPYFQLYSAMMGVSALRLFDIPVYREGVLIYLPNITLEVAEVCSGVNQLVAILCIGIPVAHVQIASWSKRGLVVMMAALIALFSNGLRVAAICLFAYYGIRGANGDIHGPYSVLRTTLISGIGFLALFWLIGRLSDTSPRKVTLENASLREWSLHRGAVAVAITLFAVMIAFGRWHQVVAAPPNGRLTDFPAAVGQWQAVQNTGADFWPAIDAPKFDHRLERQYRTPEGRQLNLVLGYFERQSQGKELVGFELSRYIGANEVPATYQLDADIRVREFVKEIDDKPHYVSYWYVLGNKTIAQEYEAKALTAWKSLTTHKNNGAIVIVTTKLDDASQGLEDSREAVRDFIRGVRLPAATLVASGQ